jgi:hypothetical protein
VKIVRIKSIEINWSYPVIYENVFSSNKISEKGIYYISRKFGNKETLLYIGKTSNSFYCRLTNHESWVSQYRGKIYVRLGTIVSPKIYDDSLVTDIESALIFEMKPFENTCKVKSYSCETECKIINTGYKGALPSVVSMQEHK